VNAPPVAEPWRRLHPLSPLVRFGRIVAGVLLVLIPTLETAGRGRGRGAGILSSVVIWSALVLISAVGGVINWAVTRWRVDGADLQIETGVIRRQSLRIPLERIQAVDIVAPLLGRLLGLAEVRVISAGRGGEKGRLAYVTAAEAPLIRARLLALAHGLEPSTPEPEALPLLTVDVLRLTAGLLLRAQALFPLLLIVAAVASIVAAPRIGVALVSSSLTAMVAAVLTVARTFNEDFDFAISEAGDGFRLDRGLLQRRHETIPFGRIQAVRVVQPLLWRPFGWTRLEVDVARQTGGDRRREEPRHFTRTLVPVAPAEQVLWLLHRVFPEAGSHPPPGSRPPRVAMVRAPLSYHFLAAWHGNRYAYARTGRVTAATVVVPLTKVQSVRQSSGPVQRALGLASVHIDTAGRRWSASALHRDERDAEAMLWDVAERARLARRTVSSTGLSPAMA
jgi:putative membrane protein